MLEGVPDRPRHDSSVLVLPLAILAVLVFLAVVMGSPLA